MSFYSSYYLPWITQVCIFCGQLINCWFCPWIRGLSDMSPSLLTHWFSGAYIYMSTYSVWTLAKIISARAFCMIRHPTFINCRQMSSVLWSSVKVIVLLKSWSWNFGLKLAELLIFAKTYRYEHILQEYKRTLYLYGVGLRSKLDYYNPLGYYKVL